MALKRHLVERAGRMDCYAATVMERGGMAFSPTGAHLPEMDSAGRVVSYPAIVSGRVPAGIMMHTTENYNTTRVPYNHQNQDIVPINSKVYLLTDGEVVTNRIDPARLASIVASTRAFVTNSGLFTDVLPSSGGSVDVFTAKFLSGPSVDGFVKVSVNMA
ncbi:MAG: hypothetical protein SGJ02_05980 [bacterium]|nr:hypothetical protein [bacterium]